MCLVRLLLLLYSVLLRRRSLIRSPFHVWFIRYCVTRTKATSKLLSRNQDMLQGNINYTATSHSFMVTMTLYRLSISAIATIKESTIFVAVQTHSHSHSHRTSISQFSLLIFMGYVKRRRRLCFCLGFIASRNKLCKLLSKSAACNNKAAKISTSVFFIFIYMCRFRTAKILPIDQRDIWGGMRFVGKFWK